MARKKLRNVTVDGATYLWRLETRYVRSANHDLHARTTFVVYLEGYRNSPGRVVFVTLADPMAGAPLKIGYAFALADSQVVRMNLHEPRHVASIIRMLRKLGWDATSPGLFAVSDGNRHLPELAAAAAAGASNSAT